MPRCRTPPTRDLDGQGSVPPIPNIVEERRLKSRLDGKVEQAQRRKLSAANLHTVPPRRCFQCGSEEHLIRECPKHVKGPKARPPHRTPAEPFPSVHSLLAAFLEDTIKIERHLTAAMSLPFHPTPTSVALLDNENTAFHSKLARYHDGLQKLKASGHPDVPPLEAHCQALATAQHRLKVAKDRLNHDRAQDARQPPAQPTSERHGPLHRQTLDAKRPASPASQPGLKRARRHEILRLHLDAIAYGLRSRSTDSDAEYPVERQWVKELTREGVEANPGPQVTTTPPMPPRSTGRDAPLSAQLLPSLRLRCHSFLLLPLPETWIDPSSDHSALGKAPKENATPAVEWCQFPKAGGWVRDLTVEGIEPNPGPSSLTPETSTNDGMLLDSDGPGSNLDALRDFQEAAKAWVCNPNEPFRPILQLLRDGRWHENIPLASPEIVSCVRAEQIQGIDIMFSGDGLANPRMPATTCIYHLCNQNQLQADALVGRHTLLFFPKALPFADQAPMFCAFVCVEKNPLFISVAAKSMPIQIPRKSGTF